MIRSYQPQERRSTSLSATSVDRKCRFRLFTACCAVGIFLSADPAVAQVVTIDTHGVAHTDGTTTIDRRFAQVEPTHVPLTKTALDSRTRLQLIRVMQAEQGFAMRPIPRGRKGLTLEANGKLDPAGERYEGMVVDHGLSAKPGDRVVVTDVKIERSKIVLLLNGGPDRKHRFLRHLQIGTGPVMSPVVQPDDQEPVGARITLTFHDQVPELTGAEVKALLAPLISFDVKTPVQAFTDTLPAPLKNAILSHHVMVGMSTDMVLFAKGRPGRKMREMDGQMPFEVWIYGQPPQDVEFVRINGNRVIRVEIAKVGKPVQVFTQDEVTAMMQTSATPFPSSNTHTIEMGDVQRNPDTQAPAPPPSLIGPGEKLPDNPNSREGEMKPVHFPKQRPDDQPDASAHRQPAAQSSGQTPPASSPAPENGQSKPADSSDPAPTTPPADGSQPH